MRPTCPLPCSFGWIRSIFKNTTTNTYARNECPAAITA